MSLSTGLRRGLRRAAVAVVALGVAITVAAPPAHASIGDKRNDFDGDGTSDVIGAGNDCLLRWSGTGSGGVKKAVVLGCGGWNTYSWSLTSPGDISGDGKADVVAINDDNHCLYAWYGNGQGGIGTGHQVGCGWDPYWATIAGAGDLNNDGAGDLVAINDDDCLVRWYGNGHGGFNAGVQVGCGWGFYRFHGSLDREGSVTGAGDLNGDGNADLAAIGDDGCLYRWLGNGNGGFGAGSPAGCGGWGSYRARKLAGLGDFNGDGRGDLVGISPNDCAYRWLGNGNGGIGAGSSIGCGGWHSYVLAA